MTIPYRTRRTLRHLATFLLIFVLIAAVGLLCWMLWLDRYVVYSRDGAHLDFQLPARIPQGQVAVPPTQGATVPIYYNDGDNTVVVDTALTQMLGYYADSQALSRDVAAVQDQILALPPEVPVMLDVKDIYGRFYYSTGLGGKTADGIDIAAMDQLISVLKTSGRYAIARLPAFRDFEFGLNHVPSGLPTSGGYLWMDDARCYWLNPAHEGTMTYLVQIVSELKDLGFDEVVFTDFRFPDTSSIVFKGDKQEALTKAALELTAACTTDRFALSFTRGGTDFTLPEGRTRLYVENVSAAEAQTLAESLAISDPAIRLVFLTEINDTRFDVYSVLRPLELAH